LTKCSSPLVRLVLFIFCLAILGSALATLHYHAVDLPQQKAGQPPDNSNKLSKCSICTSNCVFQPDYYKCMAECDLIC
jgi:hypothetical protein